MELKITTSKSLLRALIISCIVQSKSFKSNGPNVERNVQVKNKQGQNCLEKRLSYLCICVKFVCFKINFLIESKNIQ